MAFAAGSQHGLRYGIQDAFGTPATEMTSLRHTSCSLVPPKRDGKESEELTTERQITDLALGVKKVAGDFGFELSYGEFDALMQALLGGTWAAAYNLTSQTVSVNSSTKKFSRSSGSFITDGVQVGDFITTTGFADAGNNGTFEVSAVAALEITCATATGLVTVVGDTGVTITTSTQKLENGTTSRYFTFERAFGDIVQYGAYQDIQVDSMDLEVKLEQKVKGKFGLIGSGVVTYSDTPIDGSVTASQENDPYESFDGIIKIGGEAVAIVNGVDLKVANQGEADYVVLNNGDATAAQMNQLRFKLTGDLDLYFTDLTYHTLIMAGTESSLDIYFGTPASGLAYRIYLPRIKFTSLDDSVSNDKRIILKAPFQALRDDTTNKTMQVWCFPGA
jgi:hypothetical protein